MLYRELKSVAQMSLPPWGRGVYENFCSEAPIKYATKVVWKLAQATEETKKDGTVIAPPGIQSKGLVPTSCGGFDLRLDWMELDAGTQHKIHAHSYEQLTYILDADPKTCFQLLDDELCPLAADCGVLTPWRSKHGYVNIGEPGKEKPIRLVVASGPRLRPALICGTADGLTVNIIWVWPPIRLVTPPATVLNGTCTMSVAVMDLNNSPIRWPGEPLPPEL